jgi:hypothetical protein
VFHPLKIPEQKNVSTETSSSCLPAYTALSFGVETDEPAVCRLDTSSKQNFSDMDYYFGSSLFLYNHTYTLSSQV